MDFWHAKFVTVHMRNNRHYYNFGNHLYFNTDCRRTNRFIKHRYINQTSMLSSIGEVEFYMSKVKFSYVMEFNLYLKKEMKILI